MKPLNVGIFLACFTVILVLLIYFQNWDFAGPVVFIATLSGIPAYVNIILDDAFKNLFGG